MKPDEFRAQWEDADEPHKRLKWARMYWQLRRFGSFGSAKDAATACGVEAGTYRAYERAPDSAKTIQISHQHAIKFARKFNVNWMWLLVGDGTPFDGQMSELQARVVENMERLDETEQARVAEAVADMIEGAIRRRASA